MNTSASKSFQDCLQQLRADSEAIIVQNSSTTLADSKRNSLLDSLQIHYSHLESQNDLLKRSQAALQLLHQRYLNFYEYSPVAFLILNNNGDIESANLSAATLLGVERDDLLFSHFSQYMTAESANQYQLKMIRNSKKMAPQYYEIEINREDGILRHVEVNERQMESEGGSIEWQITLLDVTDRKNANDSFMLEKGNRAAELVIANQELLYENHEKEQRAAELFIANQELIFQNKEKEKRAAELLIANQELSIAAATFESQEVMMVTDANSVILRVNKAFTRFTGYSAEEAIGQTPRILSSGRQSQNFFANMWKSINSVGAWEGEIWNKRKNGEIYPEYLSITAVKNADGIVHNYVATLIGITMSQAAADEIKSLAYYDSLTLLPNRRMLLDKLRQALSSSARSGQYGALLFLDLDHFKMLNDTLGHFIGDLLLQQVANRLTSCVLASDSVARIGGDEFVVLLENLSLHALEAASQTKDIAEKIIQAVNQPYQLEKYNYFITSSIGAALINGHELKSDDLLKQADIAMYQSKSEGRNTLRFFDPIMQEAISAHADLESELRKAIEKQQFQLFYQVQVDADGRPTGAEALIRWLHPKRGMVSPYQFISLAEETGLIIPIGQWVLDTACAQLKAWQQEPLTKALVIAINVSARQFHQVDFVEQVLNTVHKYGINPALLKIELTESMLVNNIKDVITKMNELSKIGISFSLDDFGTGYSSLQYLKMLPLEQLKIDQTFVRDIATNSSDKAIVRTIITMATSLGMNVIAEGVETESQRQLLLDNGCLHFQGYLYSKPIPIADFGNLLSKMCL